MAFLFYVVIILLVLLSISLILIKSKIQIKINKIQYNNFQPEALGNRKDIDIIIKLLIFNKVPILKVNINNKKINKISEVVKDSKKLQKVLNNILEKAKTLEKYEIKDLIKGKSKQKEIAQKIIKQFLNLLEIRQIDLDILIGKKTMSSTIIYVMFISTLVSMILANNVKNYKKDDINYIVNPSFVNRNIIKIDLNGIFEMKMLHIINIINDMKKIRRVSKHVRSSNRRSYDYSYE